MEQEPFIICDNLVKIYMVADLEVVALQGLDLVVTPGELLGIDVLDHLIIGQGREYRSLRETCGTLWK